MFKKLFMVLALFSIILSGCSQTGQVRQQSLNNYKQLSLPAISTGNVDGLLVSVSDPHVLSRQGPLVISGSYYFDPRQFYLFNGNVSIFSLAWGAKFGYYPVYYYDENNGAQAGIVVYVLRNIFLHKNASLLINGKLKSNLVYNKKVNRIINLQKVYKVFTGGYIGTGKYLVVYNPGKIKFQSGDLLLYSSDLGTMKLDKYYNSLTGVNIKNFDWSKLIDIKGNLKSKSQIDKMIKPLELSKYKRVFIYYPKYWYRSGVLALYLQEFYTKH